MNDSEINRFIKFSILLYCFYKLQYEDITGEVFPYSYEEMMIEFLNTYNEVDEYVER